jgi:hypothetical protein
VDTSVGDGEFAPFSRTFCAQEGSIGNWGGDEGCGGSGNPCATVEESTTGNCCVFIPSRISGTPSPTDGCAATLDTDCWVTNIDTSTPGAEKATSSSVVYTDSNGTIPFPGTTGEYKIKITGSSVCTSNAVASNGDVTPLGVLCASC